MKGRVVTNRSRWTLCFADFAREPEYERKKGRVVDFNDVPLTAKLGKKLQKVIGRDGNMLLSEASIYFDANKCGVGFHGDTHRQKAGSWC
jgi:hypothetical protein